MRNEELAHQRMLRARWRWQAMRYGMLADEERWWWLSFVDGKREQGDRFLGACVVRGVCFGSAVCEARARECNPGGEVMGWQVEVEPPPEFVNRLLTRAECEELDRAVGGDGSLRDGDGNLHAPGEKQ